MATSNAIVGFPRWTAEATFSATSVDAKYPAANLGTLPLSYPWRSASGALSGVSITATMPKLRKVGLVVIGRHNLSITATARVRVYRDIAKTVLVYDSGAFRVWPAVFTEDQVDWDGGRWWDRTYADDEVAGYPWYRPILVPGEEYAMAVQVDINDPDNTYGYLQISLLEVAAALQFPINFAYGAQYGYRGRTEAQESDGGTIQRRRRQKPRKFVGAIQYVSRDVALGSFLEMRRQLDIDLPFFWWPDPTDTVHGLRNAYMAHFTELDLQTYAALDLDGVPFANEEEL